MHLFFLLLLLSLLIFAPLCFSTEINYGGQKKPASQPGPSSSGAGYAKHIAQETVAWAYEHKETIAITAAVGAASVIAAPAAIAAAGFGAGGVAVGSVAAAVQSYIYGGATVGIFATLQSAGVLGLAASTQVCIGAVAGGVAGAVASAVGGEKSNEKPAVDAK